KKIPTPPFPPPPKNKKKKSSFDAPCHSSSNCRPSSGRTKRSWHVHEISQSREHVASSAQIVSPRGENDGNRPKNSNKARS
ncbi:hypothetical protein IscW_ISCW008054, partial [Ixodes scapularis]